MSDLKLISPLLDGIIMGDPISQHDGIRCCPAMNQATNDKYIVKIISVPPSDTQVEAMLLTGAFASREDAAVYYADRVKELTGELDILQQLSSQEGFLSCVGYQVVPKESSVGFDVYILSDYRRSLERQMVKHPLTQLDALNLGLDLCSALTACRRNGYLFTNLKPSNIFISENGEYKISDSGFVRLDGLKYATVSESQLSDYTPPEVSDAFSSLNASMDVYAVGMILYAIFNGGVIADKTAQDLAAPAYADEELSAIILKACSGDVSQRWEDPFQMGQQLVTYIQKNGASDEPIVPPVAQIPEPEPEETVSEPEQETDEAADTEAVLLAADAILSETEIADANEAAEIAAADPEQAQQTPAPVQPEAPDADAPEDLEFTAVPEEAPEDISFPEEAQPAEEAAVEAVPVADAVAEDFQQLSLEDDPQQPQEEIPELVLPVELEQEDTDSALEEIHDDLNEMLSQIDELTAAEVPAPVIPPEPIEIILPEQAEELSEPVSQDTLAELNNIKELIEDDEADEDPEQAPVAAPIYDDVEPDEDDEPAPVRSHWVRNILIGAVIALILLGGFLFYRFFILQTIDTLEVTGEKGELTVLLTTDTPEEKLSISCVDAYGHEITVPVVNGQAQFSGLQPNTEYAITVNIHGLHVLTGQTQKTYCSPSQTAIAEYEILTGDTDTSAILRFSITGPDSENWIFTYSAPGIEEQSVTFPGHSLTLTDLQEDITYTGTLKPESAIFMDREYTMSFTASEVIQATNLMIVSCMDGKLEATWSEPESIQVESWTVRCSNDAGFDQTVTVNELRAIFTDLDTDAAYTVEVTAQGQSVSQKASVAESSLTVYDLVADTSKAGQISLSWKASKEFASGFTVNYTIADSDIQGKVEAQGNSAVIFPVIPNTHYEITVTATDGTATVCRPCICETAEAETFYVNYAGNAVSAANMHFSMCKRPNKTTWDHNDVTNYTTRFSPNDKAAFVIFLNRRYDISYETITSVFVIRDQEGRIVSVDSSDATWSSMWFKNYCELNIPSIPAEAGKYTIEVYFNGQFVEKQSFSVG